MRTRLHLYPLGIQRASHVGLQHNQPLNFWLPYGEGQQGLIGLEVVADWVTYSAWVERPRRRLGLLLTLITRCFRLFAIPLDGFTLVLHLHHPHFTFVILLLVGDDASLKSSDLVDKVITYGHIRLSLLSMLVATVAERAPEMPPKPDRHYDRASIGPDRVGGQWLSFLARPPFDFQL